ncbi:MAG: hypothetical protein LBC58_04140 [Clostridiales Family XIII bacterium]|jgi:hypothetical protein|nr:hypothetical protein [Clostridiales Family XIII bacterium]
MAGKSRKPKFTTSEIALSSILLAFILVALYAASLIKPMDMTLWSFAGAVLYFAYIELSPAVALVIYAGSALLGLIITPDKVGLLSYIIFFGVFALIKPAAEDASAKYIGGTVNNPAIRPFARKGLRVVRHRKTVIAAAYLIKGVCAAALGAVALVVMNAVTGIDLDIQTVVLAVPVFLLYDYLLWLIAELLGPRVRRLMRK